MDIGKNLAYLRKDQNLTQEQMAEKLGMSKNGYAKLERGINHKDEIIAQKDKEIELLRKLLDK